jgi:hypothetical protein
MRFALPSTDVIAQDRKGYIAQSEGIYLVSALNRVDLVSLRSRVGNSAEQRVAKPGVSGIAWYSSRNSY